MDKFKVGQTAIYIGGLYSQYTNQECVVISRIRKRNKDTEWYKVKFKDNTEFHTVGSALKKKEGDSKINE